MAMALSESRQTVQLGHRSPNFWPSQSCSLSSHQFFFECEHPFIDKLMDITEPALASTRAIKPGFETISYCSNLPRMFNRDLTRFTQSLSRVRQNPEIEKKALLSARGVETYSLKQHGIFGLMWRNNGQSRAVYRGLRLRNPAEWPYLRRDFVWTKTKQTDLTSFPYNRCTMLHLARVQYSLNLNMP